jgi:integrase
MAAHTMFDGRLQIYRRSDDGPWHAAARVGKRRFRRTTGEEGLEQAKDVAEEWYLGLRGKLRNGEIAPDERTFGSAAEDYLRMARVLAATTRSPTYMSYMEMRMKRHVLPYFGKKPLSAVNRGLVQDYRVERAEETIARTTVRDENGKVTTPGKPPARNTMLQEIVILRQVLKHAEGKGWIKYVPNLSTPYMTQGKKGRRAWFDPDEYIRLYQATRKHITEGTRRGWKSRYEDLHDYVLIMANTGLRPDESWKLEFRDVKIEDDSATKETILIIDVRGKTGVGYCKSMPNAVYPFTQLRDRRIQKLKNDGKSDEEIAALLPTMKVFPDRNTGLFNQILTDTNLKFDRDGLRRTFYSLRHTYISMRLMEGANIHMVANNCRTSVQMIEEHYASHIKDRLDAAAINVMRPQAAREASESLSKQNEPAKAEPPQMQG